MGLFGKRPVQCPAGVWTRTIYDFGKGYPQTMEVTLSTRGRAVIQGDYKEIHHAWIFPHKPIVGKLASKMTFSRRWIDGIYAVYIRPSVDCVAEVR